MLTQDLMDRAADRGLGLIEQRDRLTVVTEVGRELGTLVRAADGRWVAVPANYPVEVGCADDALDYLAGLRHFQTMPIWLLFDDEQTQHSDLNEFVVLHLVEEVADQLDGGRPEVVIVGGNSLEL